MAIYEIPLSPTPQALRVELGGLTYQMTFAFLDAVDAGWTLDIADSDGVDLVCGIPLVTGCDLLAQYAYLGFPGRLYVASDGAPAQVPTASTLGLTSHLYFEDA